jgi:tight adherence protein B
MSTESLPLALTFTGTAMLVATMAALAYEIFFRYPALLRQRLNELNGKIRNDKSSSLLDIKQLVDSASKTQSDWKTWSRDVLRQSGSVIGMQALCGISFVTATAAAICIGVTTRHWLFACLAFFIGFVGPFICIWLRRRTRCRRLTLQLPDALDFICRAVRAGQTVPAAFQMVADDFPSPIGDEFRYCYEQQNLGISYGIALRHLARSSGIMELRILVIALIVQARLGGNLSDLLENLSATVRKRIALQQRVRAITGEGRMQAAVLIALPVIVFAAMYVLNRDYAQILLDRPWLLAGCAMSQSLGAALIYKFIQIDY